MLTYDELKPGYAALWSTAEVLPTHIDDVYEVAVDIISPVAWAQYQAVEKATGVPAYVVGIIHQREASGNFRRHLHNGDLLTGRTVHVPAGRPPLPLEPPFTWAESAIDALTMPGQELNKWSDWTPPGICFVLERYNGFGYREYHNTNSPYLWGFTTAYTKGLYGADGQWNPDGVNANPGAMAILRLMVNRQLIPASSTLSSPSSISQLVPDYSNDWVRRGQAMLGVTVDGDPGPETEAAWQAWRSKQATSLKG